VGMVIPGIPTCFEGKLHQSSCSGCEPFAAPPPPAVMEMMQKHRDEGQTLRAIADRLNALGLRTPNGSAWYASTVGRALAAAA
jgi:hypothetical protein